MTKSKTKKLTIDEATLEVFRLFGRGFTQDYICEHAKANKWGLTDKVLADVIGIATDRLIEIAAVLNLDTEVGKALTRLEGLYQIATEAKETKTALAVQKEINSLLRLRDRVRHNDRSMPAAREKPPVVSGPRRIKATA